MGVLQRGVDPRRGGEVLIVDLPNPDDGRGLHAVHLVPVDRQAVELVVRPEVLQLVVGRLGLEGIPQPDVAQGVAVGRQLRCGQRGGRRVGHALHVADAHGRTRGVDVALDVGPFQRVLGRVHLQGLDGGRVDGAGGQRHQEPQSDPQDGQGPALAPDVVDEQHGGGQGHQDEQLERRQPGVHVGVAGPLHVAVGGGVQAEAGQVVAHGLHQGQQAQDDRQVGLDRGPDPRPRALEPDAAVEVVAQHGHQQHHHQGDQRPVHEELLEGEDEHVVRHVPVELGIGDPEGRAVLEEDPVVPLAHRLRPHDERQHGDHHDPQPAGVGTDHLLVALDELVLGVQGRTLGGQPLGDQQAGRQRHREDEGEHHQQPHLGLEQLQPDRPQVYRREPQRVRVEGGERLQGGEHDDQDDRHHDDPPVPAPGGRARRLGHVGGGTHERAA